MEQFPFIAKVYSSDVNRANIAGHGVLNFAIDFGTLEIPKNPVPVDFNHDETKPIGTANVHVLPDRIEALGTLVSTAADDLAASIAANARAIPYGVSPLFDMRGAKRIDVSDGAKYAANGREYSGPVSVFKGARLIGVAVCLHPSDIQTAFTPLKTDERFLIMPKSKEKIAVVEPVAAAEPVENAETVAAAVETVAIIEPEKAGAETAVPERGVKNRELQDFIDAFGMDRGVRLYQDGKTFDEARAIVFDEIAAENERLKARVAELETALSAKPETVEIVEPVAQSVESATATEPQKSEPEPAKSADALALALDRFETIVSKLDESAAALSLLGRRGDAVGLTGSNAPVPTSKSYRDAFRDAVNLK